MRFDCELRGMHFYPPAKLLITMLPTGCALQLEREPGNEYDANAIKVWLEPGSIPEEHLAAGGDFEFKLAGYGRSLEEFMETPQIMMGHIARELAEHIAPLLDAGRSASAKFAVSGAGKPQVIVEVAEPSEAQN